jgi:hypothetical protein
LASGKAARLAAGQLTLVIGREFLAPDPAEYTDDRDLLRAALDIEDDDVRRRRAAYWRWQREFLRDGMFVDQDSIQDAVDRRQAYLLSLMSSHQLSWHNCDITVIMKHLVDG